MTIKSFLFVHLVLEKFKFQQVPFFLTQAIVTLWGIETVVGKLAETHVVAC